MAIEDDYDDFNPKYHTSSDKLQYLNLAYCTAYVKASVGTGAYLAVPKEQPVRSLPWLLLLSWQRLSPSRARFTSSAMDCIRGICLLAGLGSGN
jgi:hypothetical protein